jgi:hypothetical protein
MENLQDVSDMTLEQTIAEAERHFKLVMDLIPESVRASMAVFIRSITQVTFEYMKICKERWQREVDEELKNNRASIGLSIEAEDEVGDEVDKDENQSQGSITNVRTEGDIARLASLTIKSESQDIDRDDEEDDREFKDSNDDMPEVRFRTPSGVEVDMGGVYEVFCDIDDIEDVDERKRFAEDLVKKCQQHGWI